jgi:magnesium chelatase subunit D
MEQPLYYPFSAIVALGDLRLALVLNAVNPKIGGVLIRGPKGSGKTTAVRALAEVLPTVRVVKDSPFNCSPDDPSNMCEKCRTTYLTGETLPSEERRMRVIDLPLGASEDRVIGSLDVGQVIQKGIEALEPGVLAQANQNVLYVDEVNLLPDHIADDLLDAAATGWNVVEREGISVKHPSRFIFVGTMNPEEGQLRPQLLDRFPLSAEAAKVDDVKDRVEVVKRNMEFEADPEAFVKKYQDSQEELKNRIADARKALSSVQVPDKLIEILCAVCLELKIDGIRPDIVITKTAKTLAAFEGASTVTSEHVLKSSQLALSHRTREGGFLEPATPEEIRETLVAKLKEAQYKDPEKSVDKIKENKEEKEPSGTTDKKIFPPVGLRRLTNLEKVLGKAKNPEGKMNKPVHFRDSDSKDPSFLFDAQPQTGGKKAYFNENSKWSGPKLAKGDTLMDKIRESKLSSLSLLFKIRKVTKHVAHDVGKRAEALTSVKRGRAWEWKFPSKGDKASDIYFPATIRAAARKQRLRKRIEGLAINVLPEDFRERVRVFKAPLTIVFVLDLSESMLQSVDGIKEAMLKLHRDAYRFRDRVGLVVFKEMGAAVLQHPTSNLRLVANKFLRLRMSGLTPLAAGMLKALDVLREEKRRDISVVPVMVVVTDGDANVPLRRDLGTGEIRTFDALDLAYFKYEDEVFKDVFAVSKMIKREGVFTVVVDISPDAIDLPTSSGFAVTSLIASATEGVFHEVSGRAVSKKRVGTEIFNAVLRAEHQISGEYARRAD